MTTEATYKHVKSVVWIVFSLGGQYIFPFHLDRNCRKTFKESYISSTVVFRQMEVTPLRPVHSRSELTFWQAREHVKKIAMKIKILSLRNGKDGVLRLGRYARRKAQSKIFKRGKYLETLHQNELFISNNYANDSFKKN